MYACMSYILSRFVCVSVCMCICECVKLVCNSQTGKISQVNYQVNDFQVQVKSRVISLNSKSNQVKMGESSPTRDSPKSPVAMIAVALSADIFSGTFTWTLLRQNISQS